MKFPVVPESIIILIVLPCILVLQTICLLPAVYNLLCLPLPVILFICCCTVVLYLVLIVIRLKYSPGGLLPKGVRSLKQTCTVVLLTSCTTRDPGQPRYCLYQGF